MTHYTSAALDERPQEIASTIENAYTELPDDFRESITLEEFKASWAEKLKSQEGQAVIAQIIRMVVGTMNEPVPELRAQLYSNLDQSVGVLSLSEVWDSQPMWAHYAADHKGFVFAFDEFHPYFSRRRPESDEFYYLRQVIYTEQTPTQSALSLFRGTSPLLMKSLSWSYENEWRMLVPLVAADTVKGTATDPIHLFRIPGSAIQKLILGRIASTELVERLHKLVRDTPSLSHVELVRAELDLATGGLTTVPTDR